MQRRHRRLVLLKEKHQYMLLSAYEGVTEQPEVYNTHKQAFDAMVDELAEQTEDFSAWKIKKHFKAGTLDELDGYNDCFGLCKNAACYYGSENFNWKIVCLTVQDNKITKCE